MSETRPEERGWLWRTFRYDIGRKVMALGLASVLWYLLFTWVVETDGKSLPVVTVATLDEARQQAEITPGVYVVVPEGLIVRGTRPEKVDIDYGGPREQIRGLRPSVVLELSDSDLGDDDELALTRRITRNKFEFRGEEPEFSEFKIRDERLTIDVVRESTAELTLSSANAQVLGRPQDGYSYQSRKISIYPSTVRVRGPKPLIDEFVADSTTLRLEPVMVEGRLGDVRQSVGLANELVDQQVRLLGGLVVVTVPIEPDPSSIELRSVPIDYVGLDALERAGRRVKEATREVDLVVRGPKAIINRGEDWLRRRIFLRYAWTADLEIGNEPVVVAVDLADADELQQLTVTARDGGGRPEIEFELEPIEGDG